MSAVHPHFANLQEPIRINAVGYFLDGGSIELKITDATGRTNTFALPVSSSPHTDRYPHFACGSIRAEKPNQKNLIPLDANTKSYIAYLIEHQSSTVGDARLALTALRGAPRDYASLMIDVLRERLSKI